MSRIFHQFKKDLVHQRWALVGWATLLLVHLLVSGFQILRHVPNPQASTGQFAGLVASWVVFMPLLFVILAVQSDTPMGTSAFWLTRPLRGGQLLLSKALFVALLFIILPLAIEMAILLLRGAGASTWLAIPEFSVVRLPVVMAAFALGAATQRFLHALALAAIGTGLSFAAMLAGYFIFHGAQGGSPPSPFSGSRGIVTLWALAATFTTVVVVQFLTRREGLSRCLFAVGIGGAMILQSVWPWDILRRSPQRESGAPAQVEVRIAPASITIDTVQGPSRGGAPRRQVSLPLEIGSGPLATGQFLAPVSSQIELVTASSSEFTGSAAYAVIPAQQNYRAALESRFLPHGIKLISPGDLGTARNRPHPLSHGFAIDADHFERLCRDLEEIRVAVEVGEFEFRRAGELPLQDGATWRDEGDQVEILHVRKQGDTLQIKIREQQLSLIFSARNAYGRHNSHPWVLVIINPKAKTAILLNRSDSPMGYHEATWLSPFRKGEEMVTLHLKHALGTDLTPDEAEQWRDESVLAIVRKHNLGSVRAQHVVNANNIQLEHPTSP